MPGVQSSHEACLAITRLISGAFHLCFQLSVILIPCGSKAVVIHRIGSMEGCVLRWDGGGEGLFFFLWREVLPSR